MTILLFINRKLKCELQDIYKGWNLQQPMYYEKLMTRNTDRIDGYLVDQNNLLFLNNGNEIISHQTPLSN